MLTLKLKIYNLKNDDISYIIKKQKVYSIAFRKLYNNPNYNNFDLQNYEINCLRKDVNTKINQVKTQKEKIENNILSITKEINELKSKNRNKKEVRKLFKLNNKLSYLNKSLAKDITFGKLNTLKKLSYLNNNKKDNILEIDKIKNEYKESRLLPINYIGSLNDKNSNRYFNFDFNNNFITYKPNINKKIAFSIKPTKNQKKYLNLLNEIKNNKLLPITVKLTYKFIYITFDEEKLFGYGFNNKECKLEQNKHISKEIKKQIYINYCEEQKQRKLKNKIKNRVCGIDVNPNYIGCSIIDKNNKLKVWCYDLIKLNNKNISANKRKYELTIIYKNIFNICKCYKVSKFSIEQLNFKSNNINENNKEFNRQTKNVWNINLQHNLINKYCNISGIELIEVNPVYSSFIGNIQYKYFDPCNASLEIARRGLTKYEKNNFYPNFNIDTIVGTMSDFIQLDVQLIKDLKDWASLYKLFKNSGIKYRRSINNNLLNTFSLNNKKSLVIIYNY